MALDQLTCQDPAFVPDADGKFAGYKGFPVRALLDDAQRTGTGIFTAGDGMRTDPIPLEILVQGILLHTDANGNALQHGGPLRLWFPTACGLRCGSGNPLAVKDVRRFELSV